MNGPWVHHAVTMIRMKAGAIDLTVPWLPSVGGIYIAWDPADGRVHYVGRSQSVRNRVQGWRRHHALAVAAKSPTMILDVFVCHCHAGALPLIEEDAIRRYAPVLNAHHNPNPSRQQEAA